MAKKVQEQYTVIALTAQNREWVDSEAKAIENAIQRREQELTRVQERHKALEDKYVRMVEQVARLVPIVSNGQQITNEELVTRMINQLTRAQEKAGLGAKARRIANGHMPSGVFDALDKWAEEWDDLTRDEGGKP